MRPVFLSSFTIFTKCVFSQMTRDVQNVQATFRVPFYTHDVKSGDSALRGRLFNGLVRLFLLDMECAYNVQSYV